MRRFRTNQIRPRAARRGMEWVSAATNATRTITSGGGTSADYLVLPSRVRLYTAPTLVRTRCQMQFSTGTGVLFGAIGVIAWGDRDDIPPTDSPRPYTDPDLDWVYHQYFFNISGGTVIGGAGDFGPGVPMDSRAMRKLGADEGILFVVETSTTSLASFQYAFGGRCLIKE